MEHRWGKRQPVDVKVRFVSHAKIGSGRLLNVSVTGAFMKTKAQLRLLAVLNLTSSASHSRKAKGKNVPACVVRVDPNGVGLEWCDTGRAANEARTALLTSGPGPFRGDADAAGPATGEGTSLPAGRIQRTAG